MNLTDPRKRHLQFQIIEVDAELKNIGRLYPETKPTIDVARDLLGCYSHCIDGVDVVELCSQGNEYDNDNATIGSQQTNNSNMNAEVAA